MGSSEVFIRGSNNPTNVRVEHHGGTHKNKGGRSYLCHSCIKNFEIKPL
jgi:hypothetical protein